MSQGIWRSPLGTRAAGGCTTMNTKWQRWTLRIRCWQWPKMISTRRTGSVHPSLQPPKWSKLLGFTNVKSQKICKNRFCMVLPCPHILKVKCPVDGPPTSEPMRLKRIHAKPKNRSSMLTSSLAVPCVNPNGGLTRFEIVTQSDNQTSNYPIAVGFMIHTKRIPGIPRLIPHSFKTLWPLGAFAPSLVEFLVLPSLCINAAQTFTYMTVYDSII